MSARVAPGRLALWAHGLLVVIFLLAPIAIIAGVSFDSSTLFEFPPRQWSLRWYQTLFASREWREAFLLSLWLAIGVTFLSLLFGVPAAYALARFRFRGDNHVQFWILSQRMMPAIAAIIPLFILFRRFGLTNSIAGLILIYLTSSLPFIVFMLTRFFEEIPRELEEASLVEGSSWFGAMTRIAIPLARPGIAATAIFTFIFSWNEFLFALILTSTERAQTMPVAVTLFIRETGIEWGYMTAVAVIMMIPTALLTLAAQRHLVQGLTMGALK